VTRYTVVVDRKADWQWPDDGLQPTAVDAFLSDGSALPAGHRVVNLCRRYSYLSAGYYCSLLAEARGQLPMPTVADVLALSRKSLYEFAIPELEDRLCRTARRLENPPSQPFDLVVMFGQASDPRFRRLGEECFDIFRFPILRLRIEVGEDWTIRTITPLGLHQLPPGLGGSFLAALHRYTRARPRPGGSRHPALYSLAILHEPGEKMPPSNEAALQRFARAAQALHMDVEFITRRDYRRIPEFDGLFIRVTTAIDHYTYQFARKADQEGLVVIDDPQSILRCTNKVYLHEVLQRHRLPAPKSMTLDRLGFGDAALDDLERQLGYPVVLKIPDGSFSRGIRRAKNRAQLLAHATELLRHSRLILAQEFMYTRFDWRVGVLNGQPLYLCQYLMSGSHWQIVAHRADGSFREGGFATISMDDAPPGLLDLALKATRLIGNGLYGVDIKQTEEGFFVIEVNDNPSIDHGVEDKLLQGDLYTTILQEFVRRIRARALLSPQDG
jgi:glutathione synthase/RimK-type ligase-like ATP-grasp enzyme